MSELVSEGINMRIIIILVFVCVVVKSKKALPPGAVSKEEHIKVDAMWTFDSSHHVPGSSADSVAYLRNISFSTNYLNTPDRALEFPGNIQSYMYIPNPKGDFSGIDMGAWFFYIYPDSQMSHGCILEYEGNCPGGTGLSIRFKNKKIEVKARQSNGQELYGISKTEIPFGQWSYVGVMWHVVYPEIRVNINAYTLESIAIVNLNVGDKFEADGTVRVGASFTSDVPPFKGKIGCLLFQKGYYLKKHLTPKDYCDPHLRDQTFDTEDTDNTVTSGPLNSGCNVLVTGPVSGGVNGTGNGTVPTITGTTGVYRVEERCDIFYNTAG